MTLTGRRTLLGAAAGLVLCAAAALALAFGAGLGAGATTPERVGLVEAPPRAGTVHFGEEFGGLRLAMTGPDVLARWGDEHGVCRSCVNETWYFNSDDFRPEGAGVEFIDGRVVALFTLWKPEDWRSGGGLRLGTALSDIPHAYLDLPRVECSGYEAFVHERGATKTVLYVHERELWGFALLTREGPVCR